MMDCVEQGYTQNFRSLAELQFVGPGGGGGGSWPIWGQLIPLPQNQMS